MELIPFEIEHWRTLAEQEATRHFRDMFSEEHLRQVKLQPHSYSVQHENRILGCVGIVEYWPGRGEAWAMLENMGPLQFRKLHYLVRRFFEVCPIRRVEAVVNCNFSAGNRWVRALGFRLEAARMKAYGADGHDYALYARVL